MKPRFREHQFVISSDIPIPPDAQPRLRNSKYPFSNMKIGESTFCPISMKQRAIMAAKRMRTKSKNWDFVVAAESGGIRIWRIS